MRNLKSISSKLMSKWSKTCQGCTKYKTSFLITAQILKQTKRNTLITKLNTCQLWISAKDSSQTAYNSSTKLTNCQKRTNCRSKIDWHLTSHAVSKCNCQNSMIWLWHLSILIRITTCRTSRGTKWTRLKSKSGRLTSKRRRATRTTRRRWSKCGRHSLKSGWTASTSWRKNATSRWKCWSTRTCWTRSRTWQVNCWCCATMGLNSQLLAC